MATVEDFAKRITPSGFTIPTAKYSDQEEDSFVGVNDTNAFTNRYSSLLGTTDKDYLAGGGTTGFVTDYAIKPEDVGKNLTDVSQSVMGYGDVKTPTITKPGEENRPTFEVGEEVTSGITYDPLKPEENPLIKQAQEQIQKGVAGEIPGFETQARMAQSQIAQEADTARKNALSYVASTSGLDSGRGQALMRQLETGILQSVGAFHNQLIVDRANLQRGYIDASLSLGKWQEEYKQLDNQFGTNFAENQFWKEKEYFNNREQFGVQFAEQQYLNDMDTEIRLKDSDETWKFKWSTYKDANVWAQANYGVSYSSLLNQTQSMINDWVYKQGNFEYLRDVDSRNFIRDMDQQQVTELLSMTQIMVPYLPDAAAAALMGTVSSVLMGVSPAEAVQSFQSTVYNEDGTLKDSYKDPSALEEFTQPMVEALMKTVNPDTGSKYTQDEAETYANEMYVNMQMMDYNVMQATIDNLKAQTASLTETTTTTTTGGEGEGFTDSDTYNIDPWGIETRNAAKEGNPYALNAMVNAAFDEEDFSKLTTEAKNYMIDKSIKEGMFNYDAMPSDIQDAIDDQGGPATTSNTMNVTGNYQTGSEWFGISGTETGKYDLKTSGGWKVGQWINLQKSGNNIGKMKLVGSREREEGKDRQIYTFMYPDGTTVDVNSKNWSSDLNKIKDDYSDHIVQTEVKKSENIKKTDLEPGVPLVTPGVNTFA